MIHLPVYKFKSDHKYHFSSIKVITLNPTINATFSYIIFFCFIPGIEVTLNDTFRIAKFSNQVIKTIFSSNYLKRWLPWNFVGSVTTSHIEWFIPGYKFFEPITILFSLPLPLIKTNSSHQSNCWEPWVIFS